MLVDVGGVVLAQGNQPGLPQPRVRRDHARRRRSAGRRRHARPDGTRGRSARAVIDCPSLEAANAALNALGAHTELDLEAAAAEADGGRRRAARPRSDRHPRFDGATGRKAL
ncbi:MAG: hypothetical protein M3022_00510 [Actinomycetota bacterium]|nr:hypothetical protein [Actinomycetota bacterium]